MLAAVGVFVFWAWDNGGYPPKTWLLGGLFLLGLLVAVLVGAPRLRPVWGGRDIWPLILFAGLTIWSFLSILWASDKGVAWDGANRTLLYLVVFALFSRPNWTPKRAVWILGAYALGIAGVGIATLEQIVHATHPAASFSDSRLTAPTGYSNATAALFFLPVWPMLLLASRRELSPVVRAIALATAGFLAQLGFVPESRGSLVAVPAVVLIYVAISPNRLRSVVPLVLVAVAGFLVRARLLDMYDAHGDQAKRAATIAARNSMLVSAAILAGVGLVWALLDRRVTVPERLVRRLDVAAVSLAGAAVIAGVALATFAGHPVRDAQHAWRSFKSPRTPSGSANRFTGLGSNRYDFWRVSLDVFREHPIGGVGVDNFAVQYLKHRRSHEQPLYPHSIEMRFLAGVGIVGTLLFIGFLVSSGVGALAGNVRRTRAGPIVAGALVAASYWLVHGSGDWLWEFPALSAPAIAFLGLAIGLNADRKRQRQPRRRSLLGRWTRPLGWAVFVVAVAFTLVSFVPPLLAARDVSDATSSWRDDPGGAYRLLARARRLNFLSDYADSVEGAIASRRQDWPQMRASFARAVRRTPSDWYAHLELGVAETVLGDFPTAQAELQEAHALNPRDPVVLYALSRAGRHLRVSPRVVDQGILRELPPV